MACSSAREKCRSHLDGRRERGGRAEDEQAGGGRVGGSLAAGKLFGAAAPLAVRESLAAVQGAVDGVGQVGRGQRGGGAQLGVVRGRARAHPGGEVRLGRQRAVQPHLLQAPQGQHHISALRFALHSALLYAHDADNSAPLLSIC